ncbi:hypothetical protein PHIM7_187 [Sinorhizobium phage phiM7]|uniref:Uncharacterized protein n=2 Tax=Emdodecavirus TaxID=1980937 RepID=S5M745_9CAUD|nr:hypothetical protein AB690_gp313 [Sinorhizobium phage phiM12]YP_009601312.1 hypothetical protein FDH46_gp291 [Sinorhizobium phage phiM7]AGR47891.1 hypothetical protein SmphiM12_259 [Sinorhizobium phage phiM12]AKF12732.1 hypothetical protein PHIM7_187 [Sinorhizobium phage phiM7]AKF13092.1 hypothetical protein PHIM19_187 [Sinorhizobium phage phiM19]
MTEEIQDTETPNVVYLKDYKKPTEPTNPEVLPADYDGGYDDYIDNITLSVTFDITEMLAEYGFDIENVPNSGYDLMMVIESVKSMMYRTQTEYYPLQDIAEELFEIDNPEELVNDFLNGD